MRLVKENPQYNLHEQFYYRRLQGETRFALFCIVFFSRFPRNPCEDADVMIVLAHDNGVL